MMSRRENCHLVPLFTDLCLFYQLTSRYIFGIDLYIIYLLGSLSKSRRRRQRDRHQIKGFMNKTIAVHVRYKS